MSATSHTSIRPGNSITTPITQTPYATHTHVSQALAAKVPHYKDEYKDEHNPDTPCPSPQVGPDVKKTTQTPNPSTPLRFLHIPHAFARSLWRSNL
jgi:hypothetical protein